MGSDLYFYEQCETRKVPKRYRKLPEELPESLRFAHLNPKVAALLASKERSQKVDSEDPFGDGMGKKSLLPDINAAFQNVRNQFDSALSNDEDSQRYLFEEAKISASSILQQLARIIYFYEDLHTLVPKSLEYHLMSGYSEFTNDVVVVPREWQTQEMKEQFLMRQQQEMNANSEEDASDNEMLTGRSKSRLGTERSSSELGSKITVKKSKPKLGVIEQDDTESILPKSESRQGKRSDSRLSIGSQIRGGIDVGNISRVGSRRKGSMYSPSVAGRNYHARDDVFSLIAETPTDARSTALANPLSYMQTINFQLSNTAFEDKGWVMLKGRQEEVDQNQILEYCVQRLQESLKSISDQSTKDSEQGHDKPVVVRYYGDTKRETLLKYRKSPSKSCQSPVHRGGKPKVPTIIDERNEGKKLMQASHIDGSTVVYYPSGRPAMMYSAAGFGRPGYYTIVYEDGIDSKMLACFTPSGRGVCYHDNGIVRFLSTEKGGHISEADGTLIRKWKWPQANVKITEPISFQVNNQIVFRCVGQTQMSVMFNCQREMARFSVGLMPEADEYKPMEETDQLLTAFTFSSRAAKDLMRIFAPNKKNKKKSRKQRGSNGSIDVTKQVSFVDQPLKYGAHLRKSPSPGSVERFRSRTLSPRASDTIKQKTCSRLRTCSLSPKSSISSQSTCSSGKDAKDQYAIAAQRFSDYLALKDNLKEEAKKVTRRYSKTPEPPKHSERVSLLSPKGKESKRVQSAHKYHVKFNLNRDINERKTKASKELKTIEAPEISEVSKLYIQSEAYTENWMHKKIADEESKKEKLAKKNASNKRKNKLKPIIKIAGLKTSMKSHSAKTNSPITSLDGLFKRAQSAQPYDSSVEGMNKVEGDSSASEVDQAVCNKPSPALIMLFGEKRRFIDDDVVIQSHVETLGGTTGPPKRKTESDSVKEGVEKSETDDNGTEIRDGGSELDENRSTEVPGFDPFEARVKKDYVEINGNIKENEDEKSSEKEKDSSDVQEEDEDDIADLPGLVSDKDIEAQNVDAHRNKPRRKSVLMSSINAYRRQMLAKKGIIISESEESQETEEYTEEDSDSQTSKSQSSEILKLLKDFPDKVHYDLEADKELARLQRKARNLVDDWMEHYRLALGFSLPVLNSVRDTPSTYSISNRNIKSARISDYQLQVRKAVLGADDCYLPQQKKNRIPSAPLGGLGNEYLDEDFAAELSAHRDGGVTFDEQKQSAGDGTMTPTAMAIINRLADTASRKSARSRTSTSARSVSPSRQPTVASVTDRVPSAVISGTRSHCPLVIRQHLLGYERPQCRCSRHHIPYIMDLELDEFINTETPDGQLTVIMIVSSLFPGITKAEEMLNEIYGNQNRNRTRPCVQSRSDMFRVFKYDINSAAEMSDHTQPLLMTRHNVVPGMFLIYCDGKLTFCDHIFNGYGNTRKDFKKQIMKSRHDAIHGFTLPKDFRFSPSQGKSGMRSAWGGEIGGAGVDKYSSAGTVVDTSLHPIHRPHSDSSNGETTTSGVHLEAVKEKVDLGPFHREIQVRLKPLVSYRVPPGGSRLSSRRPFLPPLDSDQTANSALHQHESVHNWISASFPTGSTNSNTTTSLTTGVSLEQSS